jgi:error-prone DNA polymerase
VPVADERLTVLLCTHSTFSFGAGTATPGTLVRRAAELGYQAIALTDTLNVSGVVELFQAAREAGIQALIGATLPVRIDDEVYPFVALALSRRGYRSLNELITHAHARSRARPPLAGPALSHRRPRAPDRSSPGPPQPSPGGAPDPRASNG